MYVNNRTAILTCNLIIMFSSSIFTTIFIFNCSLYLEHRLRYIQGCTCLSYASYIFYFGYVNYTLTRLVCFISSSSRFYISQMLTFFLSLS